MAFSLNGIFNESTLSAAKEADNEYKTQYIHYEKIKPNPYNKKVFSEENIQLLSYAIEDKYLFDPLRVSDNGDGTYTVCSGHRRRLAILDMIKRGNTRYEYIPCIVKNPKDELERKEILLDGNAYNRPLTPAETASVLSEKIEILKERKKNGEVIQGKLLDLVAEGMSISKEQAKKYNAINNKASDSVIDEFEQGNISTETAYQLSKIDKDTQEEIVKQAKEEEKPLTAKDVKDIVKSDEDNQSVYEDTDSGNSEYSTTPEDNNFATAEADETSMETVEDKNDIFDVPVQLVIDEYANTEVITDKADAINKVSYVLSTLINAPEEDGKKSFPIADAHKMMGYVSDIYKYLSDDN